MSLYQRKINDYAKDNDLSVEEDRSTYYFYTKKKRFSFSNIGYNFKVPNIREEGGILKFARNIFYAATMEGRKQGFAEGHEQGLAEGLAAGVKAERARIAEIMKSRIDLTLGLDQETEAAYVFPSEKEESKDEVL